jgi:Flp pilus assembly pilin Flp
VRLVSTVRSFRAARKNAEEGANLLEYGLLATLIAVVVSVAVQALGGDVLGLYEAGVAAFP